MLDYLRKSSVCPFAPQPGPESHRKLLDSIDTVGIEGEVILDRHGGRIGVFVGPDGVRGRLGCVLPRVPTGLKYYNG